MAKKKSKAARKSTKKKSINAIKQQGISFGTNENIATLYSNSTTFSPSNDSPSLLRFYSLLPSGENLEIARVAVENLALINTARHIIEKIGGEVTIPEDIQRMLDGRTINIETIKPSK